MPFRRSSGSERRGVFFPEQVPAPFSEPLLREEEQAGIMLVGWLNNRGAGPGGSFLLHGRDLRSYDLEALRANIGVIFQDFVRYHMTAGDNLAAGRIEVAGNEERILVLEKGPLREDGTHAELLARGALRRAFHSAGRRVSL